MYHCFIFSSGDNRGRYDVHIFSSVVRVAIGIHGRCLNMHPCGKYVRRFRPTTTIIGFGLLIERKRKKSLARRHVEDIGSTMGIQSYERKGYAGVMSGKGIATSRHPHLYVMAVLSGARVLRVL